MLYDNEHNGSWNRVYAVLCASGFTLHSTGKAGSSPIRPVMNLTDIKTLYAADPTDTTVPHMQSVMLGLEFENGEVMMLRTAEPKALKEWVKMFLQLHDSIPCKARELSRMSIDDMRVLRCFFSPALYTQLFRNRPDSSTSAGAKKKMPDVPTSCKALAGRRASMSAGTPSRGSLPQRRTPLIPIVSATHLNPMTPLNKIEKPAEEENAATVEATKKETEVAAAIETAAPVVAEATTANNDVPTVVEKENVDALPVAAGIEEGREASPPLSTASPNRAMNRLNRLKSKTLVSDTCSKDDVIANLKKQVENLTRRNVELQLDNVNAQSRILDLEQMLSDAQNESENYQRRSSNLQRQIKIQEENFNNRLKDEKEELMHSLKEEIENHWGGLAQKWLDKEAAYKSEIALLETELELKAAM